MIRELLSLPQSRAREATFTAVTGSVSPISWYVTVTTTAVTTQTKKTVVWPLELSLASSLASS